jgi:ABC-type polysaccharide/polyol phosphate export permease
MSLLSRPAAVQISTNFVRKLLIQRYLIWNFVVRDLKGRYIGSLMGFLWSVVHPFVLLISYTFVFSIVFKIRPTTLATDNFAVFLFCGILPWLYFQDTLVRSCSCVQENANLIRKTIFPSEILPVSLVISNLAFHLISVAVLLVVLLWMGLLQWTALLVPLLLLPLMVLCLGLGWILAALQVFLRDTLQVLSVALIFWFWFTPIFYSVGMVPRSFQPILQLNPLAAVVEGYRACLLEGAMPSLSGLGLVWAWALAAFVLGGYVFRNTKREFIDVL